MRLYKILAMVMHTVLSWPYSRPRECLCLGTDSQRSLIGNRVCHRRCPHPETHTCLIWLAIFAANVVAESIGARSHTVAAPAINIAAAVTLTADPDAVQLGQATGPRAAVRALCAAAHGTWVVVIDALFLVKIQVFAR